MPFLNDKSKTALLTLRWTDWARKFENHLLEMFKTPGDGLSTLSEVFPKKLFTGLCGRPMHFLRCFV